MCAAAREILAPYSSSLTAGAAFDRRGDAPWDLFARADAALLWAKRNARGTATLAEAISGA
jgi:predicted signal transduction protein with EAL and GGDEF domain